MSPRRYSSVDGGHDRVRILFEKIKVHRRHFPTTLPDQQSWPWLLAVNAFVGKFHLSYFGQVYTFTEPQGYFEPAMAHGQGGHLEGDDSGYNAYRENGNT